LPRLLLLWHMKLMRPGNLVGGVLLLLVVVYFLTPGFAIYFALHSGWVSYEWFDVYYMPGLVFAGDHIPMYQEFSDWESELMGMKP
jgi:hypothetical protein